MGRTPEQLERYRAAQRERYRTDPEYREKLKRQVADRYRSDPKVQAAAKEAARRWNQRNPEKRRETVKAWFDANPGKRAEYAANVDKEWDRERSAAYRAANPEKRKAITAVYREKNREKVRAYNKQYSADHLQELAIKSHNRRVQIRENGGVLSKNIVDVLMAEQGGKCSYCMCGLEESGHHIDHVMPIVRGGPNTDENVQLLCPPCNYKKNARHPLEYMTSIGLWSQPMEG